MMKPDRADLYPDAAYQSEIFCKDSKRERRAEPVRACPNRLLSDAKIVKAERSAKFICWSKPGIFSVKTGIFINFVPAIC
jgi:hypothetical protein